MVERLLELGVNPKLVTLEMGDTPLHAALSIALDKDTGWSCCLVYVEKGHTPLHAALSIAVDEENGQVCCVCCLCGERPHTLHLALVITLDKKSGQVCCVSCLCGERPHALHPALVIAVDKENGQVCCVCCVHLLCGERWHMDIALDMHLVICRKRPRSVLSVLVKPVLNWANVCSPNILRTVR